MKTPFFQFTGFWEFGIYWFVITKFVNDSEGSREVPIRLKIQFLCWQIHWEWD